jgi:TetR/AcrR family transcriptional regulator, cholesterol catabolism regulator
VAARWDTGSIRTEGAVVPRVAEDRRAAEPTSAEQKERYQRILRAAARHGAAKGLERVQMLDVARDAGVAIATLYRYFPSKTQLFTALMRAQVDKLLDVSVEPVPGESPEEGIARLLVRAGRDLLRTPLLAHAMMQSNNATVAQTPTAGVTEAFTEVMLAAGGIDEPTALDLRLLRLLEQAWYGILITALNGHISLTEFDDDTRLVCRLLLGDRTTAGAPA